MMDFYARLLWVALGVLALLILGCIFRAVRGPKVADRLVAVNMMTTLVTIGICILTFLLGEGYLADVALIFSLLGCLAVVVLTRIFLSLSQQKESTRKGGVAHVE
ncbi:MAG: sodium:proton antiporter [Clostridia bacterium]|nr:sodium:proton antiporter [Clostridia bacterium]